jgi:hypothetical protein
VLTLGAAILLVALGCAAAAVWGGGRNTGSFPISNGNSDSDSPSLLRGTGPGPFLAAAKKGGCGGGCDCSGGCGGGCKKTTKALELAAATAGHCGCGGGCGCAPCHPGCACGGGGSEAKLLEGSGPVLTAAEGALAREGCGKGCDCSGGCGKGKAAASELEVVGGDDTEDDAADAADAVDDDEAAAVSPLEAAASPLGPGGVQLAREKKKKGKGKGGKDKVRSWIGWRGYGGCVVVVVAVDCGGGGLNAS